MPKAKAKRNWKHIHKIKVHDNRWLMWALSISILVSAVVVAYIQVSNINFDTQMNYGNETTIAWSSFSNNSDGYNLKYPKNWDVENETENTMSFVDPKNANDYFSITTYPSAQERQVRTSLAESGQEQPATIAGLAATYFAPKETNGEKVVLVKEDSTVYVLRGKAGNFERIVQSFRFNQEIE